MPSRRQFLAGLGSVGTAALAGCLGDGYEYTPGSDADADWPMPRFDAANTAYSPDAKAPRDGVQERWAVDVGMATAAPAVVDGTVYLPTAEALVALDAANGEELWRFSPERQPWPAAPAVHDGVVYVTAIDEAGLYAVDAASGEEVWALDSGHRVRAAPHLVATEHAGPMLYAGTESGTLFRLDPKTGEQTWRTDVFGGISAIAYRLPSLYVGTFGGEVYAFSDHGEGESGREGWRRKVGSKVEALLPDEEGLLVHTFGGPLRCLQSGAHAGTTRWTVDAKWANSAPVSAGYTFFAAGYDALSATREYDAKQKWRVRGRYDRTGPVAAGDTLYASSGEAVHAFALDGGVGAAGFRVDAKRWSHETPAVASDLAVADGALFAAAQSREDHDVSLYCLEPA